MPIDDLIRFLRLLDEQASWRLSDLPNEITHHALIELDRFKLIETRLWENEPSGGYRPNRKTLRDGFYVVSDKGNRVIAGTLEGILANEQYQGGREPEFRVSPTGADWLRDAGKRGDDNRRGGEQVSETATPVTLTDPIPVVKIIDVLGRASGGKHLAEKMQRRNYTLEKRANKWYCQRADALTMFPNAKHRERIQEI